MGPFARNGMQPTLLGLGRVTRLEAARQVVAWLAEQGLLAGIDWDALAESARESWVKAITEVYGEAAKQVSKEGRQELAEYEELALLLDCRRCGAGEMEPCRDQRVNYIKAIKHPHAERIADMEAS